MRNKYFWIFPFCLFMLFTDVMPSLADTTVGGVISSDTTWTLAGSPYNVTSTVQVYGTSTTPATLTIEPGVVVKFASGTGLQIGSSSSQGALVAQGTSSSRITFIRSGTSGTWGSVTFLAGTVSATTDLENVDIQYSTGVTITSSSPTIRNSTITNVTGNGLYLTSANPTIDTVTVGSAGSYGIYLSSSSPTITNSTITNNGSYGIYLSSSSPTVTGGSLTNTSATGQGIYGSGSPVISNYTVSSANSAGIYGLYLSTTTSALSVTNSTVSNGLYIGSTAVIPTVSGNTFTNLDNSPLHAGANIIGQIVANNTLTGQTSAGRVEVVGEQVSQNTTWNQLVAPYVVVSGTVSVYNSTTTASTLTIAPGTVVKFASGTGLQIGNSTNKGALVAQGTTASRITLTRSGTSGTWGSVSLQAGTVNATTDMENVDIQYSSGVTMTSCAPTIRNATITSVTGYGLNLSSANPVIDTVTITNNGSYGINLSSSSPIITGGSLTNTSATGQGIYGSGSPLISNYTVSSANSAGLYGLYLSSTTSALSVTNSTISNGLYI
ncbi:MAG TPA: right-handed parallel beta-helix repeat-containing protein, partial [Geobacteraceae bacterium]